MEQSLLDEIGQTRNIRRIYGRPGELAEIIDYMDKTAINIRNYHPEQERKKILELSNKFLKRILEDKKIDRVMSFIDDGRTYNIYRPIYNLVISSIGAGDLDDADRILKAQIYTIINKLGIERREIQFCFYTLLTAVFILRAKLDISVPLSSLLEKMKSAIEKHKFYYIVYLFFLFISPIMLVRKVIIEEIENTQLKNELNEALSIVQFNMMLIARLADIQPIKIN